MGKILPEISEDLRSFIEAQPVFFVATAPLSAAGHVNLSPKGLDTLRVLSPRSIAYLDLTGSGNETAAHISENGRITLMWCAFLGPPRIVRVYGHGTVIQPGDPLWADLRQHFGEYPGVRQIIVVEATRIQTSCGFGVPLMQEAQQRDTLLRWAEAKGSEGLTEYRAAKNIRSIDGLSAPMRTDA